METAEQTNNTHPSDSKPWLFKPGQSGNPSGRPKGTISLKEYARKYIQELPEEEKLKFMEGLPKDIIWKMAEGNPKQDTDITSDGKPLIYISPEIADKHAINPVTEGNSQE